MVWAKNVDTGDYSWKPVTKTWVVDKKPIYRVSVKTKQDLIQTIDATSSHPFFVKDKGWVDTLDLIPGDNFENKEGNSFEVLSIEDLKKQQVAYNFTVADFHTYYVTKQNVLVHNCNVTKGGMLGANGTKTANTTLWKGKGKERIDVENPNPGQRPGQVHYQDNKNNKYLYEPKTNSFRDAPKSVNKMLNDKKFKGAIDKAMTKYLGE
ncbi:intein [Pleionea mediterranea]|uniref:Intein n=1 Tax=Pleionea mediterranea TaxID=523701 RepID=A0A316FXA4_9GAMM|nr:intein [Pleionea mediterranea]